MNTELNPNSRFVIPPQVMSREVGDETVLLDIAQGIYFGLDGVGKHIWENVAHGMTVAELAVAVTRDFDVGDEQAQTDVADFLRDLVERGLLLAE